MASFSKINSFMRKLYNKSLFATNTGTCIVLLGIGDCLTQYIEQKNVSFNCLNSSATTASTSTTTTSAIIAANNTTQMNLLCAKSSAFSVDWSRFSKMLTLGTVIGPMQHLWYSFLDRQFPKKTASVIVKKIIIDQLCFATTLNIVIIAGLHILDGEKLSTLKNAVKEKFLTLYAYDCSLWVPAQLLNFNFVTPQHRVLYVNLVTLIWNIITSFVMFSEEDQIPINSTFE